MAVLLYWCMVAVAAASGSANTFIPRDASGDPLAGCPGYKASRVQTTTSGLTADLTLAGKACNVYGADLKDLTLEVVYESSRSARSNSM